MSRNDIQATRYYLGRKENTDVDDDGDEDEDEDEDDENDEDEEDDEEDDRDDRGNDDDDAEAIDVDRTITPMPFQDTFCLEAETLVKELRFEIVLADMQSDAMSRPTSHFLFE